MKKITHHYKYAMVLSALLLSGCATTNCDPSNANAGFFEKMGCDIGGGYRESVDRNEQALVAARNENLYFQEIYRQIEAQKTNTRASLNEQQQQNARLDQSLSALLNQVKAQHGNRAGVQQRINQLEQQLQVVKQGATNSDTATMRRKQQELEKLQSEVKELQNYLIN